MKIQNKFFVLSIILCSIAVSAQKTNEEKREYVIPSAVAVTPQNLEQAIKNKSAAFVVRAFHNGFDTKEFEAKYGVRIIFANCVGSYFGDDKLNNKTLAKYLSEKFGEIWKKEIPIMPADI